ncbi:hypothetical protein ACFL5M_02875 [Candidatus Neomarinimicrobiota bacterium]
MKKYKALFVVVLGAIIQLPTPMGATDTRVETLGASGSFLEDQSNIWGHPSTLLRYPNQLVLSLGGQTSVLSPPSNLKTLGTFKLPSGMVLGMAFGSAENDVTFAPLQAEEQVHLFCGIPKGNRRYGLRLSRFGAMRDAPPQFERSVGVTQLHVGLESGMDSDRRVEITVLAEDTRFSETRNGELESESTGYWRLGVNSRLLMKLTESVRLIPLIAVTAGHRGAHIYSEGEATETTEEAYYNGQAGVGFEINTTNETLVIIHASTYIDYVEEKTSVSSEESGMTIWDVALVGMGIEKWVFPWLALRVGAGMRLRLEDSKEAGVSHSLREIETLTAQTLGLGVRLAGIQADFAIEPLLLKRGPHFISGTSMPLSSKATLSYEF